MAQIVFLSPNRPHKSGDVKVYEIAEKLEKEFQLCEKFTDFILPQFEEKFTSKLQVALLKNENLEVLFGIMGEWLKNEWRDYIRLEKHGIRTKSANLRNGKSFIITTDYYLSMDIRIEL